MILNIKGKDFDIELIKQVNINNFPKLMKKLMKRISDTDYDIEIKIKNTCLFTNLGFLFFLSQAYEPIYQNKSFNIIVRPYYVIISLSFNYLSDIIVIDKKSRREILREKINEI